MSSLLYIFSIARFTFNVKYIRWEIVSKAGLHAAAKMPPAFLKGKIMKRAIAKYSINLSFCNSSTYICQR